MIRRTITTLTLAAVTTIGVATAAPALAAPPSDDPVVTDTTTTTECVIEVGLGITLPCPDLGSIFDGIPGADDSGSDGGVVTDPIIEVDIPDLLIIDIPLPPIVDLTPVLPMGGDDAVEETPEEDVITEEVTPFGPDEIRGVGTDDEDDAATPEAGSDSSGGSHDAATPTPEATVDDESTSASVEGMTVTTDEYEAPTTTVADTGSTTDTNADEDVIAAIELGSPAEADDGIDPATAALFGSLAMLAMAGTGFAAFRFGRRSA